MLTLAFFLSMQGSSQTLEDSIETNIPAIMVKDTFYFRQVPDSVATMLKSAADFAYANDPEYWVKEKIEPSAIGEFLMYLARHEWIKVLLWFCFLGLLVFALVKIILANRLNLFYRSGKQQHLKADAVVIPENYAELIKGAVATGDFRLAIRFHYLQTLQQLHEKKLIDLHPDGTNQQYLGRMRGHSAFNAFNHLTKIYDYAWYGAFAIDKELYGNIAQKFAEFDKKRK